MDTDPLRELPTQFLTSYMSHFSFEESIKDFPEDSINKTMNNQPFTLWELLEHIRRMFQEIMDYVVKDDYEYIQSPDKYWPLKSNDPVSSNTWRHTISEISRLYAELVKIINDPSTSILAELKHQQGSGHTYLRQIIMVIDHNSYHLGQFVLLRKLMGIWR